MFTLFPKLNIFMILNDIFDPNKIYVIIISFTLYEIANTCLIICK